MKQYYNFLNILNERTLPVPENWDEYKIGPFSAKSKIQQQKYQWIMYKGGNDWQSDFRFLSVYTQQKFGHQGETSRLWLEVQYPPEINDKKDSGGTSNDVQKLQRDYGNKVADLWLKLTNQVRKRRLEKKSEYDNIMNEENKKLDAATKVGKDYDRNLPKWGPPDTDWFSCFKIVLLSKEMKPYIKQYGIDYTEWKESKRDINMNEKFYLVSEAIGPTIQRGIGTLARKLGWTRDMIRKNRWRFKEIVGKLSNKSNKKYSEFMKALPK